MPPYEGGPAPIVERDPTFADRLAAAKEHFGYDDKAGEPGEPIAGRRVNIERLKIVPLPALQKMQMLIDECERYLSKPIWKDKYDADHEARQNAWKEGQTQFGADVMEEIRENNRIKINKMTNVHILARHSKKALDSIQASSPDLDRLRTAVDGLYNAFGENIVTFATEYNRGSADHKMAFAKEFSGKIRAYLEAVT